MSLTVCLGAQERKRMMDLKERNSFLEILITNDISKYEITAEGNRVSEQVEWKKFDVRVAHNI